MYELIQTDHSFCPHCGVAARLFCPTDTDPQKPAYYLCFGCGYIGQVGVGPVVTVQRDELAAQTDPALAENLDELTYLATEIGADKVWQIHDPAKTRLIYLEQSGNETGMELGQAGVLVVMRFPASAE